MGATKKIEIERHIEEVYVARNDLKLAAEDLYFSSARIQLTLAIQNAETAGIIGTKIRKIIISAWEQAENDLCDPT